MVGATEKSDLVGRMLLISDGYGLAAIGWRPKETVLAQKMDMVWLDALRPRGSDHNAAAPRPAYIFTLSVPAPFIAGPDYWWLIVARIFVLLSPRCKSNKPIFRI
jgi:hypothetical protein